MEGRVFLPPSYPLPSRLLLSAPWSRLDARDTSPTLTHHCHLSNKVSMTAFSSRLHVRNNYLFSSTSLFYRSFPRLFLYFFHNFPLRMSIVMDHTGWRGEREEVARLRDCRGPPAPSVSSSTNRRAPLIVNFWRLFWIVSKGNSSSDRVRLLDDSLAGTLRNHANTVENSINSGKQGQIPIALRIIDIKTIQQTIQLCWY